MDVLVVVLYSESLAVAGGKRPSHREDFGMCVGEKRYNETFFFFWLEEEEFTRAGRIIERVRDGDETREENNSSC